MKTLLCFLSMMGLLFWEGPTYAQTSTSIGLGASGSNCIPVTQIDGAPGQGALCPFGFYGVSGYGYDWSLWVSTGYSYEGYTVTSDTLHLPGPPTKTSVGHRYVDLTNSGGDTVTVDLIYTTKYVRICNSRGCYYAWSYYQTMGQAELTQP